jgi:imidazoleglycerol-phosphate dehydratase/histidinol-phosphatase
MKKVLFIDRDGTILREPSDEQIDSYDKFRFLPGVIRNMHFLCTHLDYEFVMVSNQDGLGTDSYPEDTFWPTHNLMLQILEDEGVMFDDILIDRSFPSDNLPTRKPGVAMLKKYMTDEYDLANSYVIGDRITDVQLAKNLGCKALYICNDRNYSDESNIIDANVSIVSCWDKISELLYAGKRMAEVHRTTSETDVYVCINLDGTGKSRISTGLGFFDHMLEQIARHGGVDLILEVKGDLHVDEHHTIEDAGIAVGECLAKALVDKRGLERYGYCLPMDDCLAQVSVDFGGRSWLVWDVDFKREYIGDIPTEMFFHFFKSLTDSARINLNIKAEGNNEHHKIEGVFKAFARSLKMALRRDIYNFKLPSSKGML